MSRFLLVELEPDLAEHQTTRESVFRAISMTSGVRQIIDLSVISQTTLDAILLKPTPLLKRSEPSTYNAIRHYWKRKRQPRLLPE